MNRILVLGLLVGFFSCGEKKSEVVRNVNSGAALGTSYNLIYLTENEPLDLQKEIDSVFKVINKSLSTYIPDSDISRINQGDSTVVVDAMFRQVYELSKEAYLATDGYFDPTVGLLVNAWGFGPEEQIEMDSAQVQILMSKVGFDNITLTSENRIRKSKPNMYLDFNAIAKGYSIDRLAVLMDSKGIENYLLEVGGELVAKGVNQVKQKEWVVGIDDPQVENGRQLKLTIRLKNQALASSGNYRHFRVDEATGKKYVHTIDPITGFTKNANTLATTIIAENCALADAYATAFMAMDLDDALKLLAKLPKLDAYIIYVDENGETQEFMSPGFEKIVASN